MKQDQAQNQNVTGVERKQAPYPDNEEPGEERGRSAQRPDIARPFPHPAPKPASSHNEGYQHQGFSCFFFLRPMATAAAPLTYTERKQPKFSLRSRNAPNNPSQRRARKAQNGRHAPAPSWRYRPRAPSLHRSAEGGVPTDALPPPLGLPHGVSGWRPAPF